MEHIHGRATIESPNAVVVDGQRYETKHLVIATGGYPEVPNVPGSQLGITSDGFFELPALPKKAK